MNRIEAAYTLIVAEADERLKEDGGDYCGKLVDVAQEVDHKLFFLMKITREKERKNETTKG